MGLEYFSSFAVQGPCRSQHCYNILLGSTKRVLFTVRCRPLFVEMSLSKASPSGRLCDAVTKRMTNANACVLYWKSVGFLWSSVFIPQQVAGNEKEMQRMKHLLRCCCIFFWGGAPPARPPKAVQRVLPSACDVVWIPARHKQNSASHHYLPKEHKKLILDNKNRNKMKSSEMWKETRSLMLHLMFSFMVKFTFSIMFVLRLFIFVHITVKTQRSSQSISLTVSYSSLFFRWRIEFKQFKQTNRI